MVKQLFDLLIVLTVRVLKRCYLFQCRESVALRFKSQVIENKPNLSSIQFYHGCSGLERDAGRLWPRPLGEFLYPVSPSLSLSHRHEKFSSIFFIQGDN